MARRQPFSLVYVSTVKEHLRAIERRHWPTLRAAIEEQLRFESDRERRNRKPLTRAIGLDAEWELRSGPGNRYRIFYEVDRQRDEVRILAVGAKDGSRPFIGGEEVTR